MNKDILFQYIKYRVNVIITALICLSVSFIVLWIYNIPLTTFLLIASLVVLLGVIVGLIDYQKFNSKHVQLRKAEDVPELLIESIELSEERENSIENAINLIEEDYLKIILKLSNELNKTKENTTAQMDSMTDYYTMWVHQIKTPIAAMSLIVQKMEDEETSLRLRSELTRIESYSAMALNYIRLNSETNDLNYSSFEVDDLVRETIKKMMSMFIAKDLSVDFSRTNSSIVSDRKWLMFIIEQLLSNAIKYQNKGEIKIYGDNASLTIEDEGIGIAPEDLPRIMEKGYTGYNGHNEKHSTGLGLYLVKNSADMLNIDIKIESTPGVGTKVHLIWGKNVNS